MNKCRTLHWVLSVLFFCGLSIAREPRTYAVWLRYIPAQEKNCHELAQELALRFTQITGLEGAGRCQSITKKGMTVEIRYVANEALELLSSMPEIGFPGEGFEFGSRRQCEAQISSEEAAFEKTTGQKPVMAFCNFQENYYGRQRWGLVMYGFGNLALRPQWASSLFPGQPSSAQVQKILDDVKTQLNHSQMDVRLPFLQDDDKGHLRLTLMYYGRYGEQIKSFSLAEINSLTECENEMQELRKLQQTNPAITTLGYCIHNPYHRGADLVAVIDVTRWYQVKYAVESFTGYEDCRNQRPTLVPYYQNVVKDPVVAGFCTKYGSEWKLLLIEKNTR